jgi:hyperosmotically inducible protein
MPPAHTLEFSLNGARTARVPATDERILTMNTPQRTSLMVALVAGIALVGAACSDREATTTSVMPQNRTAATATPPADGATTRAGAAIDDAVISTSVKTAVLAEPGLSALKIDVDTKNGVVTLSGTVDSPELKSRATQIAQRTSGVRSVIDNLEVKTG